MPMDELEGRANGEALRRLVTSAADGDGEVEHPSLVGHTAVASHARRRVPLSARRVLAGCSLVARWLLAGCSLAARWLLTGCCSLVARWLLLAGCSLVARWLLAGCSLVVAC